MISRIKFGSGFGSGSREVISSLLPLGSPPPKLLPIFADKGNILAIYMYIEVNEGKQQTTQAFKVKLIVVKFNFLFKYVCIMFKIQMMVCSMHGEVLSWKISCLRSSLLLLTLMRLISFLTAGCAGV